jgi:predicted phosphodiesterase
MKFAIIADIHANLEALQVVLADSKEQKCTHYACVGDVVGYGANPKECLDIVRSMGMPTVKGNHDEYCSIDAELEGFNPAAAEAVTWTRKQLTEEDRQWLRDLKYFRMVTSFSMVHATLDGPQRWGYVFDKLAAAASFTYQNTAVCFFGHTHVPVAFIRDTVVKGGTYSKFKVDPARKYFVNVGSVGQPRDNNPKSA